MKGFHLLVLLRLADSNFPEIVFLAEDISWCGFVRMRCTTGMAPQSWVLTTLVAHSLFLCRHRT